MLGLAAAGSLAPPPGGFGSSPPGGMGVTSQGFGQEGYILDSSDVGPMARPRPEEENFVVGVPYYLPFATPYRDSWEIFRDDPVTIRQLIGMRRQDGQARALYRLVTMPILAALKNAAIVPPEEYEPVGGKADEETTLQGPSSGDQGKEQLPHGEDPGSAAEAETEFIHNMFFLPPSVGGMTHSFNHFIRRMLLATFDGFSGFEMVYWVPKTGPMKNMVTIRKMDWRPAETLTFLLDGQGEFNGFRQRTFFQGRTIDVKIPKERAFYFANGEEERPFYGISLFESAFYHYDKKVKLYYITHLAAQRAAVGTRVGTMPPNPAKSDKQNFTAALRDLGMAQYIVVPSSDWTVTSLNEVQSQFDYLGLINHHNNQMSKSVLASWFDSDQGSGNNEGTLLDFGNENDETFMMMEQAIMDDMAWNINHHIIPRFIDWNFGSAKYPVFRWGVLTEEQQAAIQDTFDKLAAAPPGAVSRQFLMELEKKMAKFLGLDIDYGPIEREANEEDQMQQKLNRSQMQDQLESPSGGGMPGMGGGMPPPGGLPGAGSPQPQGAGQPPGGGGAPPRPPTSGGARPGGQQSQNPVTGFSRQDRAMVSLVGEILADVIKMRGDDPYGDDPTA